MKDQQANFIRNQKSVIVFDELKKVSLKLDLNDILTKQKVV